MRTTLRQMQLVTLFFCTITAALHAQSYSGGAGTSGDPYQIATKADLKYLSDNNSQWGYYFKQTADISFVPSDFQSGGDFYNGGAGFNTIGVQFGTYFTGQYDGNGHTISGMKLNASDQFNGMFGIVNSTIDPTITGLGLLDVDMTASGAYFGALVAYLADGSVTNCYTTGIVRNSNSHTGGLVGATEIGTTISTSYSACTVTGVGGGATNTAGGFSGQIGAGSTVTNCYAKGAVGSATSLNIGGFSGMISGTLTNSYSVGPVSGSGNVGGLCGVGAGSPTVTNCFWDTEASGTSNGGLGTGKTTAQMKTLSTFTGAGWDFSGTWEVIGSNYPRLVTNADQALPVELISFNAAVRGTSADLQWNTATEKNNFGFEIQRTEIRSQRSEGSSTWEKVGFVEGKGTSNTVHEYSFADRSLSAGSYSFRLKQIDRDGKFEYSQSVEVTISNTPTVFALEQNYPNPFNPSTAISYQLSAGGMTTLIVYDAIGREVATLVNEVKEPGSYTVRFGGSSLASGIYFARLTSGNNVSLKKMSLVK